MVIDKINSIIFNELEIRKIITDMAMLVDKLDNTYDTKTQLTIIDNFNELRDHYLTLYWCSYLGYLKNIEDDKYLESEKIFSEVEPQYNNLVYKYYQCLNKFSNNNELIQVLGKRTFTIAHNQSILLNEENNSLFTREKELCKEYRKLIIGTKFEFNGEIINLSKLSKYFQCNDENLRKSAYDKRYEILISLSSSIDNIVEELIKVRHKIACNLGFNNYKEYGFVKMNRIGYDEEDLIVFKETVVKYFVPLMESLIDNQKIRLGVGKIDYYNENYLFNNDITSINITLEELINIYKNIYKDIDNDFYQILLSFFDNGLIDLEDRENKSNGGLTTYLPDYKYPTFIKKYIGTINNITSINHELGHMFQLFYSKCLLYHENRWPTFDICEIHSTANELLLYPYMDRIFGEEKNKYFISHLTHLLAITIKMCAIDDFNSKLYENPNLTKEERNSLWNSIYKKYYPNNNYSHEYYKLGIMWQADINRIDNPFYGIDYSLATICAFSFYEKSFNDKEQALSDYLALCKDGGSLSLKELIAKHNLYNPFKEEDIRNLSIFIEKRI